MSRSKVRRRLILPPEAEALEVRVLLSNVTLTYKGENLVLKGDANNNYVVIRRTQFARIEVEGREGTTINGETDPFVINEAILPKGAKFLFNQGGNNTVFMGAGTTKNTIFKGGSGNDYFAQATANVVGKLNISTSDGDDMVALETFYAERMKINLGNGETSWPRTVQQVSGQR